MIHDLTFSRWLNIRLHLLPQTKGSSSVVCAKCRESRQFSQTVMLRNELWCILFPLIICRMFLNLADWTDLGSHRLVCIRSHSCMLEHKPSHEVQGAVCSSPTQDCIEHRLTVVVKQWVVWELRSLKKSWLKVLNFAFTWTPLTRTIYFARNIWISRTKCSFASVLMTIGRAPLG